MTIAIEPRTQPGEIRQKALREELRELADVVGPGPLVDMLLERAFQLHATDIHFDPTDSGLRVRLRVDGLLHDVLDLPAHLSPHVTSRIKLMAGMDITERRMAQDGHISNAVLQQQRDIRVGSGPTVHGERLVLRLMPDHTRLQSLDDLGFEAQQVEIVRQRLRQPHGLILSVGPVGCGKSTTMYSCLEELNDDHKSLVTIEDPVERKMAGINQIQIDSKFGFNFVDALRGVLRQDPDVMMVGEIRDPETAQIAVRAGLTGILVLSTLHANDTGAAIDVFREFGIPAMFLAESLKCIVSQRLVRRICPESFESWTPDPATCAMLDIDPSEAGRIELRRGVADDCNFHTGYRGRSALFEVMNVDAPVRDAILRGASHPDLMQVATSRGMQTLEASARRKVLDGETTVEEMHRVLAASGE